MLKVYTKPNCPYCVKAKELLRDYNIPYTEIDVTQSPDALAFIKDQGLKTVPQIFRAGVLIEGGYTGLTQIDLETLR